MTGDHKYPPTSRTDRFFLRIVGEPLPGAKDTAIEEVGLYRQGAASALERLLSCTGKMQGGLLFGYRHDTALNIGFAAPAGVRPWHQSDDPTDMDAGYVLGWMDCLRDAYSTTPGAPAIDWIGNWIAYPDSRLRTAEEDLQWIRAARQKGLIDQDHLCLFVGWRGAQLAWSAYLYDPEAETPVPVEVTLIDRTEPS